MAEAARPEGLPRRGGALSAGLGRAVLRLMGWRIDGELPPVPRCVLIVAPHTSNWDFVVGLAAKLALRLDARFLGKHTLFRGLFGAVMRRLGGIPVDRSAADGVVEASARLFASGAPALLAIAPEGTRRKVARWKTGFHRIARAARVPILLVSFDYGRRAVGLGPLFQPTDDLEADLAAIRSHYDASMARHPDQF